VLFFASLWHACICNDDIGASQDDHWQAGDADAKIAFQKQSEPVGSESSFLFGLAIIGVILLLVVASASAWR
jgi:hypothetical protein